MIHKQGKSMKNSVLCVFFSLTKDVLCLDDSLFISLYLSYEGEAIRQAAAKKGFFLCL